MRSRFALLGVLVGVLGLVQPVFAQTPVALSTHDLAATKPVPVRQSDGSSFIAPVLDATLTGRLPAGASPADNESNTNTNLSRIGSFAFIFDGSTWDRWTGAVTSTQLPAALGAQGALKVEGVASGTAVPVSGTFWQTTQPISIEQTGNNNAVDVLTMPTTTVTATNLDVQIGGSDSLTIGTFPDNEPVNVAQVGGAAVAAGPCEREVPLYVAISQTTGTQLITGTASERVYVCSISVVTATAQNIALVDGTGSVCATSPTGLLGGSTAATGWNFAANGGIVLPFNPGAWNKTSTDADNVCLLQSSTGQVSGVITYVSVPNI